MLRSTPFECGVGGSTTNHDGTTTTRRRSREPSAWFFSSTAMSASSASASMFKRWERDLRKFGSDPDRLLGKAMDVLSAAGVRRALEAGADADDQAEWVIRNGTCLQLRYGGELSDSDVAARQLEVVRVLDEFGCLGADSIDEALHFALPHATDVEVVRVLVNAAVRAMPDFFAGDNSGYLVDARTAAVAQLLIDAGANINAQVGYSDGGYVLHKDLPVDVARVFLNAGASLHVTDMHGCTPLHTAVLLPDDRQSNMDVLRLFIEAGADVHAVDVEGRTPLHDAEQADVVQLLLAAGADARAIDCYGNTVLHKRKEAAAVRALAAAGADVLAVNEAGSSVLHRAVEDKASPAALAELVAAGAAIDALDGKRTTALDEAIVAHKTASDMLASMRCLLALGADPGAGIGSHGPVLQSILARQAARIRRIQPWTGSFTAHRGPAGAKNPRFEGCGGSLVRILARAMAWRRRRHILLAIRGRYGVPAANCAAGGSGVGCAASATDLVN